MLTKGFDIEQTRSHLRDLLFGRESFGRTCNCGPGPFLDVAQSITEEELTPEVLSTLHEGARFGMTSAERRATQEPMMP